MTSEELKKKDFSWFEFEAQSTEIKFKDIINKFKKNLPMKSLENNILNISYDFEIKVIEQMRHIIVHKKGVVDNKVRFKNKVLKELGVSEKSDKADEFFKQINLYFGKKDCNKNCNKNCIFLLEFYKNKHKYIDVLGELRQSLMSYVYFTYTNIIELEKNTPLTPAQS
ncbi:hypothetical protein A8139_17610 [Marinomonas primoryensis]|uniref:Uncharacterized protein n=1 Tax=Marinomonas primoryensis TaxID=178399 RepID=A0A2Z4PVW6_9GAMM|nr:hypothetical protein [Marinomonas primoryensis]AWY01577.1 hypothetical protein A8139_17610 [Marinomonas primoryensis]